MFGFWDVVVLAVVATFVCVKIVSAIGTAADRIVKELQRHVGASPPADDLAEWKLRQLQAERRKPPLSEFGLSSLPDDPPHPPRTEPRDD